MLMPILWLALSLVKASPTEPVFDSTRSFGYLTDQCGFGPRINGSEAHARALKYFTAHFQNLGFQVIPQNFVHRDMETGKKVDWTNLIVKVKGKDLHRKPMLFCSHWDSRPRADQDPNLILRERPILGANDGASGVAVLMELANQLAKKPPLQSVYIVLFDGEDYGKEGNISEYFLGARYFSKNLPEKSFAFALLLDMIGDRDLNLYREQNSVSQSPLIVEKIWTRAQSLGLQVFKSGPGPSVLDDHMPLQAVGIPAIDLIDFDYPPWHTLGDTPDKCSAFSLGNVGRLVASLAYEGLP